MSAPRDEARHALLLVATVASFTVPFLSRPYHIDDDIYLKGAEQILREPLSPLGGTQHFIGEVMPTYHFTQHPPLVSYYMAAVKILTGRMDEPVMHAAFVVFPVLAAFAMYALARRFTAHALPAALLLVTTPAFVVMSQGVMTDLPFLSLYLTATAAFVYGIDRRSGRLLSVAAVAITLACFVQYRAALLVGLLAAYAWLHRGSLRTAVAVGMPAAVGLMAWSWHNWADLGVVHLLDAGSWIEFSWSRAFGDAFGYAGYLGSATVSPLFIVYAATQRPRPVPTWIAALLPLLAAAWMLPGYPPLAATLVCLAVACGLAALIAATPAQRPDRDALFLLLMVAVPLLSQVVLNIFASVRSLLLAVPFLTLLLVRRLELGGGRHVARLLWAGVALTAVMSAPAVVADGAYAAAARDVAVRAREHLPAGTRGWFTGEWGFRHYIERAGFGPLTVDGSAAAPGDIVVIPTVPTPAHLAPAFLDRLELIATIDSHHRDRLTTMSFAARAGFYSNFWGLLPYAFSDGPLEHANVYRVARPRAQGRLPYPEGR